MKPMFLFYIFTPLSGVKYTVVVVVVVVVVI